MATVTVSLVNLCAGNCHAIVNGAIDGTPVNGIRLDANEVAKALTASEAPDVLTTLLRVRWRGKTKAQIAADVQAGFTMTI